MGDLKGPRNAWESQRKLEDLYPATLPLHGSYDLGSALKKNRPQKLFG